MTTCYAQLLDRIEARLEEAGLHYGHGTENAGDEAAWLLSHVLGLDPREPADPVLPVEAGQVRRALELVEQRIDTRKPLAYLINSAWFCGLEFFVDERVIVPRSPVAESIERDFAPWLRGEPARVLDVCTGAGCIAVACALQFPGARVDATDISPDALAVARRNVECYGLQGRLSLYEADVFDGLPPVAHDLIVANPPYVDARDMADLAAEYRHEPALALAAGDDGLAVVRRLLREAPRFLAPDGVLVCEVGNSAEALERAFPRVPFIWLEFERGGEGVFTLDARTLHEHRAAFSVRLSP